ncbi:deoxyribose-phosphate aldolase [Pontibacter ummariensis]|uniref:Deoxyribose-phosphate aldolase n=1 Tax=Pontibacter ummariensis TaxID=1610492 RepID=A0A239B114_9BACT|nr:deoxyribose-phosphate aldolase [Pontibacter ummariensis]PRY16239.1 deoxyribose-phosphate aldolase [Pontibacter ummariensis]SNS01656.1 deoxyribose-phosphate aldolase [Pontibacter ummariensis]
MAGEELASYIDHTQLKPDATAEGIAQLCDEARSYGFAAVCVPPCYVTLAKERLGVGTTVKVATVVGFPLGYQHSKVKFLETHQAIADGAVEIDVVMNVSAFKSGKLGEVERELGDLAKFCHLKEAILKVIIETALLSEEEIVKACELCVAAGADYVKTSTGFAAKGATVENIALMRRVLPNHVKIKASGGIRTFADAEALIKAGADRLGCSASIKIVTHEQTT